MNITKIQFSCEVEVNGRQDAIDLLERTVLSIPDEESVIEGFDVKRQFIKLLAWTIRCDALIKKEILKGKPQRWLFTRRSEMWMVDSNGVVEISWTRID